MSKAINLLLARVETLVVEKKEAEDKLIASFDRYEDQIRELRDDVEAIRDQNSELRFDYNNLVHKMRDLEEPPGFQEFVIAAKQAKEDAFVARMNATAKDNFKLVLETRKFNRAMIRDIRSLYDNNHKINAIKEAREFAKVGLKEAKDFVEHLGTLSPEELEKTMAQVEKDYEVRNPLIPTN
jgi:ribosomal protein L7/L12